MKALASALFAALVACGPVHVNVSAPPRTASAGERLQAYQELRPFAPTEAQTGVRGGVPPSVLRTSETLRLAGGQQVRHPEDLIPALPSDSEAVQAAHRSQAKRAMADWLTVGGVALLVAGAVVAASPFVTAANDESVDTEPIYIGAGVFVLSIPLFLLSGAERRKAAEARARTFELYEPELRRRLDVCQRADAIVPCR